MSILKLEAGRTYELALKRTVAKESTGYTGIQFLYTLASPPNHVLYLPPVAHAEVQSLHLEPGECFTLLKSIGAGNAAVWSVERVVSSLPSSVAPNPKPMAAARSILPPRSAAPACSNVPIPPSLTTRESQRIFTQLVAVIQGCQAAERFGDSIGFPVKFGPEDIRAMAISGFIEQSRRAA